jgi:2'-5' RNA ligase
MQKYVLVQLLEGMDEGTEFPATNWPLHVTLASNFIVDCENTNLLEKLSALLANRKPIKIIAGEDEYFGQQKHIQVMLLEMNAELASLHNDIVALLKSVGAVFDEPQYLEAGYRAHASVQRHVRLHKGDVVNIDELTIIDMFPHNDIQQRKVLRAIKLAAK